MVRHDAGFQGAVENSEEKVLGLCAQFLRRLQLLRRRLEQHHLFLFFLALQTLKGLTLGHGQARIADPQVRNLIWQADENAIRSHIAK